MKRWMLTVLTAIALIAAPLALHGSAVAVDVFGPCSQSDAGKSAVCNDASSQGSSNKNPIVTFIKTIIQIVALIIGVASVIIIVVSALRFTASAGNPQVASSARNGVMYAAIGLILALMAEALVAFVLNRIQ